MTDAEQIAAKLSKAQKRAVFLAKASSNGRYLYLDDAGLPTLKSLHNLGVADSPERPSHLTPIGIDVRKILQDQTNQYPTPEQIADGWKVHDGSGCPVPLDSRPAIMFRDGCIRSGFQASSWVMTSQDWWKHEGPRPECNIIAYKEEPKP